MQHPPKKVCKWLGEQFPNLRIAYGHAEDKYFLIQLYPQSKYGTYQDPRIMKCPWYVGYSEKGQDRIDRGPIYMKSGAIGNDFGTMIPVIECEFPTETVFSESDYKTLQFGDKAYIDKKRRDELWDQGKKLQSTMNAEAREDVDYIKYQSLKHGYRVGGEVTMNDRIQLAREAEYNVAASDLSDLYVKHGTRQ